MTGMREGRTPAQYDAAAQLAGYGDTEPAVRRDRVIRGYDNLISNGLVTRSDVYFSVPQPVRTFVAKVAEESGQYWAPGRRGGLHAALRQLQPAYAHIDLEVCVRYGPMESLYGDMYTNLRRYELLLWGFLRGVLVTEYGDDADDWRGAGWWRRGLREPDRRDLASEWVVRDDIERPWQAATFGTMQKVVEGQGHLFARACKEPDAKALGSEARRVAAVRNAVMHPLSGKVMEEEDFAGVAEALLNLVRRSRRAIDRGFLLEGALPTQQALLLPEILRERLYPDPDA